jgi:hypothetical protein
LRRAITAATIAAFLILDAAVVSQPAGTIPMPPGYATVFFKNTQLVSVRFYHAYGEGARRPELVNHVLDSLHAGNWY